MGRRVRQNIIDLWHKNVRTFKEEGKYRGQRANNLWDPGENSKGLGSFFRLHALMLTFEISRKEVKKATAGLKDDQGRSISIKEDTIKILGGESRFSRLGVGTLHPKSLTAVLKLAEAKKKSEGLAFLIPDDYFRRRMEDIDQAFVALGNTEVLKDRTGGYRIDSEGLPKPSELVDKNLHAEILKRLRSFVKKDNPDKLFVLWGMKGAGKTTVLSELLNADEFDIPRHTLYRHCSLYSSSRHMIEEMARFIFDIPRDRMANIARNSSEGLLRIYEQPRSQLMTRIREEIDKDHYLFVIDGFFLSKLEDRPSYHLIRDDWLLEPLRYLLSKTENLKVILVLNAPLTIDDGFSAFEEYEVTPKNQSRIIEKIATNDESIGDRLQRITDLAGSNRSPTLEIDQIYLKVIIAIMRSNESTTDIELLEMLQQRDLSSLLEKLCNSITPLQLDLFRLACLAEDGIREDTFGIYLHDISGIVDEDMRRAEIRSAVFALREVLLIKTERKEEDRSQTVTVYDINPEIRHLFLARWERFGDVRAKRKLHRFIARFAWKRSSATATEIDYRLNDSLFQARRYFQCFIHLLASADPEQLKSEASAGEWAKLLSKHQKESGDFNLSESDAIDSMILSRNLDQQVFSGECGSAVTLQFAMYVWNKRIERDNARNLSRNLGAEQLKTEMLCRLFHIGYSFPHPMSSSASDPRRAPAPPATWNGLSAEQIASIYREIAEAAYKNHEFVLSGTALQEGLKFSSKSYERAVYNDLIHVALDVLTHSARLEDAIFQAEWELNSDKQAKRWSPTNVPDNQIEHVAGLYFRLGFVYFLHGEKKNAAESFDKALRQFGGSAMAKDPRLEELKLRGKAARYLVRFACRSIAQDKSSASLALQNRTEQEVISGLFNRADQIVAANLKELEDKIQIYENDRASLLLNHCGILRTKIVLGLGESNVADVNNAISRAEECLFSGSVSAYLRLEILMERARVSLLLGEDEEAGRCLNRVLNITGNLSRYPLMRCDALLLSAELPGVDYRESVLNEAYQLIHRYGYKLRWPDWEYLKNQMGSPSKVFAF